MVQGEAGVDGTFTRVGNYTDSQVKRIDSFLQDFFSSEQVTTLIENGIVEINRIYLQVDEGRMSEHFLREGRSDFVLNRLIGYPGTIRVPWFKVTPKEETDYGYVIKIEYVKPESGQVLKEQWVPTKKEVLPDFLPVLNPEMKIVFSAAQSTRKKISISELSLPVSTNVESQLAKQGYNLSYTRGIDRLNEWIFVRRRLQELKANPYVTHVEYFVEQIPAHIAYIRKGLEDNYSSKKKSYGSRSDQLQKLKDLEEEAEQAVVDKKITYKWWLEFNIKLAEIMSGVHESYNYLIMKRRVLEVLTYFPLKMIVPTIKADVGIMTFNRAGIEGIYPVGLTNQQTVRVHAEAMSSFGYLEHDYYHALLEGNRIYREYSVGHRLFHKRLLANIERLPSKQRKKAEAVYFIVTHENDGEMNVSYNDSKSWGWNLQNLRDEVEKSVNDINIGVFRFPDDFAQKEVKVQDLADTFMEVYNQTLQHQF